METLGDSVVLVMQILPWVIVACAWLGVFDRRNPQ